MGRKAESPPSRLWERLTEALNEQGLPATQLGVAKMLGMSHTSVRRWYHGEGDARELDTYRKLALKGKVTVDWLLTGRKPKFPISSDPALSRIVEICIDLDQQGREAVLNAARRERARRRAE